MESITIDDDPSIPPSRRKYTFEYRLMMCPVKGSPAYWGLVLAKWAARSKTNIGKEGFVGYSLSVAARNSGGGAEFVVCGCGPEAHRFIGRYPFYHDHRKYDHQKPWRERWARRTRRDAFRDAVDLYMRLTR